MNRCVLCGIGGIGHGHNAQPLQPGRCCTNCNTTRVIPYRMMFMFLHRGEEE